MKVLYLAPLALAAVITACAPVSTGTPGTPGTGATGTDACGASAYQGLVGQPRSRADAAGLPTGTRIIPFGAPVTMDLRSDRLNILLNNRNFIETVRCG